MEVILLSILSDQLNHNMIKEHLISRIKKKQASQKKKELLWKIPLNRKSATTINYNNDKVNNNN